QSGQGTYYDVGLGSCGQTNSNSDMVAAMNAPQYDGGAGLTRRAGSSSCGKKLCVSGPKGQTTVTVVDKCPGCSSGDLDLSPSAFNQIADPSQGRVPITWS
ncbi:MAG: riboflavin-aldehyde forming enzyme, partial [Piptocephalis tieghemiana]